MVKGERQTLKGRVNLTANEVERAVRKYETGMAARIACGYYFRGVSPIPQDSGAVQENFKAARRNALKRLGVLDKDNNVVPGNEEHARRWGFLSKEEQTSG